MGSMTTVGWLDKLRASVPAGCHVLSPQEPAFKASASIFNAAQSPHARVVVLPRDAQDVSSVVRFAREHNLSLSVKGGGYNTAGWSVKGELVLDLALMNHVEVHPAASQPVPLSQCTSPAATSIPLQGRFELSGDSDSLASAPSFARKRTSEQAFGAKLTMPFDNPTPFEDPLAVAEELGVSRGSKRKGVDVPADPQPDVLVDAYSGTLRQAARDRAESRSVWPHSALPGSTSQQRLSLADPLPPVASTSAVGAAPAPFSSGTGVISLNGSTMSTAASSRPPPEEERTAGDGEQAPYLLTTIGAGARTKDIDTTTAPYGYHVPLAAYPVGSATLSTGGFGFLSRKHGLTMDNVVEAEIVLSDGRVVHLRDYPGEEQTAEEKELWWAFRGAGVAFSVVTRVRARAVTVGQVLSGSLIYPFNPITTPSLMKHWRDCCKNAPREMYCNFILTAGPENQANVVIIQPCFVGAYPDSDALIQTIMAWEGERCLFKDIGMRTFMTQQDSVAQVLKSHATNRWCIRAELLHSLSDEMIHKTVAMFNDIPERSAWLFELSGGAIADVKPSASCFPHSHRAAPLQVAAIHQWRDAADDQRAIRAAEDWIYQVIRPQSPGGSFPCFLERPGDSASAVADVFGSSWSRLVALKQRLDPTDLFRHTFWPRGPLPSSST